jgi:hypothetical protein
LHDTNETKHGYIDCIKYQKVIIMLLELIFTACQAFA